MSISKKNVYHEMCISNQKVYTKSLYLIEKSISNRNDLYEMSISNRKVYTKSLYETEKSIRKVFI